MATANETIEEIAEITQAELGEAGAIRYLNTWESPGSISLAVHRRSLAAVQAIPLPVQALGAGASPTLMRKLARIRGRISKIEATRQDELSELEKLRQRWAARHAGPLAREPTPEQRRLLQEISKMITCEYLPGVSLTVRERFSDVMSAWARAQDPEPDDVPLVERFSAMAAVITGRTPFTVQWTPSPRARSRPDNQPCRPSRRSAFRGRHCRTPGHQITETSLKEAAGSLTIFRLLAGQHQDSARNRASLTPEQTSSL